MAEPEPVDPTPEPIEEPHVKRPDWLVGAEEGAQSELTRNIEPGQPVDLKRPMAPDEPNRVGLPLASRPAESPPPEPEPTGPIAWRAAASSVPQLRLVSPHAQPSSQPELSRRVAPEELEEPEPEEPAEYMAAPLAIEDEIAPMRPGTTGAPRTAAPIRKSLVLDEPWWLIAFERLATDRKLQLILGGSLAVVIALVVFWPHSSTSISLANLRHHPDRYQGQSVQVEGRVGDVFSVGGAYAFNLHQGRDTLVVYTRSRMPVTRQKVKVTGSLSMGYLDGVPRLALFETGS
jgi:hypothetical protein